MGFVSRWATERNTIWRSVNLVKKYNSTHQSYQAFDSSIKRNYFDLFPWSIGSIQQKPDEPVEHQLAAGVLTDPCYENLESFWI